jgi:site-specific recombinase XerD
MDFITGRARDCKPGSVKVIAASLRSYLRFLAMRGLCHIGLMSAVPTVPSWRLSHIPKTMPREDLRRFLSSIERSTAKGRRDYAMALCLTELGLRAREVAELRLEDIDWREARLKITGSKTRRGRVLPLPRRVGQAIAGYLRRGRPRTAERRLFLTHRARPGLPGDADMIRRAMASAYRSSGAKTPWAGPHVLRHTVATCMLERGAKMKDLADVLGHGSIDTAAIYAKVNLRMLSHVAMPWPEARS